MTTDEKKAAIVSTGNHINKQLDEFIACFDDTAMGTIPGRTRGGVLSRAKQLQGMVRKAMREAGWPGPVPPPRPEPSEAIDGDARAIAPDPDVQTRD
jgi:hypothetical protein